MPEKLFNKIKLMFFHAPWCGQCKAYTPTVHKVVVETGVQFVDINADEDMSLCEQYGIMNLPVVILVNGDKKVRIDGMVSKENLLDKLNSIM